ncbi:MAG: pyrroline-5-carboxylate reductase [Nitrososphaerota archaeon]
MSQNRSEKGHVVAVLGAGVVGGAVARALAARGEKVIITRRDLSKSKELKDIGIEATQDNSAAVKSADVIFICVKPFDLPRVLREIKNDLEDKLVISTVATIPLDYYVSMQPKGKFVRSMPNIALLVQESFTAYVMTDAFTSLERKLVHKMLSYFGYAVEVEEKYMDAITALSGSGPGYLSIILEGLVYAGLKVGLPRDLALQSSLQTMLGTAKLIKETKEHPSRIKDLVVTPGGTTIEGIYELEGSQIRQALMKAVERASEQAKKIRESVLSL